MLLKVRILSQQRLNNVDYIITPSCISHLALYKANVLFVCFSNGGLVSTLFLLLLQLVSTRTKQPSNRRRRLKWILRKCWRGRGRFAFQAVLHLIPTVDQSHGPRYDSQQDRGQVRGSWKKGGRNWSQVLGAPNELRQERLRVPVRRIWSDRLSLDAQEAERDEERTWRRTSAGL